MGEWKEAYIESKDAEPAYWGGGSGYYGKIGCSKPIERLCWGIADREGLCKNIVKGSRVYCDDCRAYFDRGEWKNKETGSHD
jgi:hypothetical protein